MKRFRFGLILILLLLLVACGGGGDEAVQDTSETDSGAVDEASDSEAIDDGSVSATGSEEDSGALPPTPEPGSKVNAPRATPATTAALGTAVPPANRVESEDETAVRQVDVLLLLDATGSMAGELRALRNGLDLLANTSAAAPDDVHLRYGFVTYRDQARGAAPQIFNLTDDWALFAANIAAVKAVGGGDYPEDLSEGLQEATANINWHPEADARLIILVGDAPPHLAADGTLPYTDALTTAVNQSITVYTVGSEGLSDQGEAIFQEIARGGNGRYFFLSDNLASSQAAATAVYPTSDLPTLITEIVMEVINGIP